MNIISQS